MHLVCTLLKIVLALVRENSEHTQSSGRSPGDKPKGDKPSPNADFRCREPQIFAGNRRKPHESAENPQIGVCPIRFAPCSAALKVAAWLQKFSALWLCGCCARNQSESGNGGGKLGRRENIPLNPSQKRFWTPPHL